MIYIIVLLLMLACVYAYDYRGYKSTYYVVFWAFFVALVVIAGLRYRIGTDSIVYEKYYENVPALWELGRFKFESTRFEPGFLIFASIPRSFSSDFMWLQFCESIVINGVIFWFILKNTSHRFLCLTFYYLIMYFNLNTQVMREALAVALFLLAWPSFRDGKWIRYYILTVLASFMHTSALFTLLVPLFCLPGIRELFVFGRRTLIICMVILGIGIFIGERFASVFHYMAMTQRMVDRVNEYSKNAMSGGTLNIAGIIGLFFQYCLYPLVALYYLNKIYRKSWGVRQWGRRRKKLSIREQQQLAIERKKIRKENRQFDRWQMMTLIGIYMMVFSIPMFIFRRYFNYFGIFSLATIATWAMSTLITSDGRKKLRLRLSYWVLILLPFFFINLYAYASPANRSGTLKSYQIYYPYYTRLNPEMDHNREAIYKYWDAR